jgi:hypothetical protein
MRPCPARPARRTPCASPVWARNPQASIVKVWNDGVVNSEAHRASSLASAPGGPLHPAMPEPDIETLWTGSQRLRWLMGGEALEQEVEVLQRAAAVYSNRITSLQLCRRVLIFLAASFLLVLTAGRRSLLACLLSDAEPFSGLRAFARCLPGLSRSHARFRALSRALLTVRLRISAELTPVGLGKIDVVVVRGFLDVRERHGAIGIRNVDNLIEACDRIPHMPRISQRLFPLPGERKDRVRQVALRSKTTALFVRLPG